jgi:hypothetical protein
MKREALQFALGLFIISNSAFAQQWNGSTTASGDISRDGGVVIGASNVISKLTVFVNQQNDGIWLSGSDSKSISLLHNTGASAWNPLTQAGDNLLFWRSQTADDPNAGGLVIGPWSDGNKGMRITSAGNVGIGTSTPEAPLEVRVDQNNVTRMMVRNLLSGNSASARVELSTYSPNSYVVMVLYENSGSPYYHFGAGSAITSVFYDAPEFNFRSATGDLRLKINNSGNVGIGTDNPGSYKLAVEGNIAARGVKVTLASFADYVFDSTYQLRPLSKVEQYINQNKHLPGIPSAKEVEKEGGVELGEMNVKLLEKVEELTLYMIELKKENEEMKKEIKELKEKK